jgi:signal peptidase I
MSKKKPTAGSGTGDANTANAPKQSPRDGLRETIESVVIAFVLAFLFRTFEAEAFVIPTGSMATTLMGRHKELTCVNCGFPYRVSASDEEPRRAADAPRTPIHVVSSICPECRYEMHFGPDDAEEDEPHVSYNGDRILVAKFPYDFGDPQRWDVAVFKNPGEAKENYIKRVAGVPDETLIIFRGDVLTAQGDARDRVAFELGGAARHDGRRSSAAMLTMWQEGAVEIQRKPPAKARAMLQLVYDNNYLPPPPMPPRWAPLAEKADRWEAIDGGRGLAYDGQGDEDAWIGYQHRVPSPSDWRFVKKAPDRADELNIGPALITDFYAYNSNATDGPRGRNESDLLGSNWVGDLSIACKAGVRAASGQLLLALVEGGCHLECRIDVATGTAQLSISDMPEFKREVATAVRGPGDYHLQLANVDNELLLWVDGKSVAFDGKYGPLGNFIPTRDDLTPVRLGSHGADVRFSDLKVLRDVYYTSTRTDDRPANFFEDPTQWDELDSTFVISYQLGSDQYFMLGDNSPRSSDGRLWSARDSHGDPEYYVDRDLFIGKAVFIYWPHAWRIFPSLWFPFYPNVKRMEFVR